MFAHTLVDRPPHRWRRVSALTDIPVSGLSSCALFLLKVETSWSAERRGSTRRQTLSPMTLEPLLNVPAASLLGNPVQRRGIKLETGRTTGRIISVVILFYSWPPMEYYIDRLLSKAWHGMALSSAVPRFPCCFAAHVMGLSIPYHVTQYQQPVVWDGLTRVNPAVGSPLPSTPVVDVPSIPSYSGSTSVIPSILLYPRVQLTETPRETLSLTSKLRPKQDSHVPKKRKRERPHVSHQLTLVNPVSTPPSLGRDVTPAVYLSLPEPRVKVRDSQYAIETELSETGWCFAFTLHPPISLRPLAVVLFLCRVADSPRPECRSA